MCESGVNIMADLLACRVCLATGVNLYNMYDNSLKNVFENLTGVRVSIPDSYPHYLCMFCQHLLLKSSGFKERCLTSLDILKRASMEVPELTLEHIHTLSLTSSPTHSFSVSPLTLCTIESTIQSPSHLTIKLEKDERDFDDSQEFSDQSDEEPLSKKVTKKEKQKKINYSEFEFEEDNATQNVQYTEFENDSFEKDKDVGYSEFDFETDAFDNVEFESISNDEASKINAITDHEMEVVVLTKEEQIKEILARKESCNYQNSFYKCEFCFKGFITDSTFKNHMTRHDPSSGDHECEVCHTRWPDARSLKSHQTTAHERQYICKLCNHIARSWNRAKEHIRYHNGHTYVCKMCGSAFTKSTSYLTHIRLQHPSKFCCDVCGESFIGETGLNMHKKKTHNQCKEGKSRHIFCGSCKTKFKNIAALRHHTSYFGDGICDNTQSSCAHCGDNFNTPELLKEHLQTHSDTVKCDQCNRTFASERSYSVHYRRVHSGIKLATKLKRPDIRRRHHCVCEICGVKCNSSAALMYHQRIHTGEKPFQCADCPKSFSVYQRLQIHIRTHTGERPFKCSHCPKAFKHKAALNRHDRVHTGAKPYECPYCAKSFSQSNSMKLHVRTVHLKLPAPYRNRGKNKITAFTELCTEVAK